MKFLLFLPIPALVMSCTPVQPQVETLPPVIQSTPTTTKPKPRSTRNKVSKPKVEETVVVKEEVNPLTPDPTAVTPVSEVPRFKVPENVQPKVPDGIDQGLFIELKW